MPTRREFLATSTVTLGSAALAPTASAFESFARLVADVPIVDTHQHLWDLDKLTLPWLQGDAVAAIRRSFVTKDYLASTKDVNLAKAVYMEVNVREDQQPKEAQYVIDLCGRDDNPTVAATLGCSPQKTSFAEYAKKYGASPYVKGFRTVLHDPDRPKGMCLEPTFVQNMQLLGELGLRYDLCMRPGEIGDGAKLAAKCPKTKFVIDHCGNMPVTSTDEKLRAKWKAGIRAAAALENTVCKISGIVVTATKDTWKPSDLADVIGFCLETFGEDRVFFGGDWPVCRLKATYAQWVAALHEIVRDRTPAFKKKLFHDNAVRFYELETA